MTMFRSILGVFLLCVVLVSSAPAEIVVDNGGGGDYLTIQEGITAASEGETVRVIEGTYTGAGNRNLDFGTKNIVLRSNAGAEVTTIDLENVLGNRAFQFISSGQDTSCVIDGFTVTNCLTDETHGGSGAAVYMSSVSPKFINMIFSNCDSTDRPGGAIYMLTVGSPVFRHVRFENCHAASSWGGRRDPLRIRECTSVLRCHLREQFCGCRGVWWGDQHDQHDRGVLQARDVHRQHSHERGRCAQLV
jgi:hypothetical protein